MSATAVAVVPVFDGQEHLVACVEALVATAPGLEIVVVDDASRDASLALARRFAASSAGRIRIVARPANGGFAAAVNDGVAAALERDPAFVVLVNQDCVVRSGWLEAFAATLADPRVAVAGARLLEADGVTLQHAGARVEANGLTTHFGRGECDASAHRELRDCDYVCGALVAIRSDAWRGFGPLDEGFAPAYFEEVDFCCRVRAAGLRVVYAPRAEAVHAEASASGRGSAEFLRRYHRSRLRFVARHLFGPRWLAAELRWLATLRRPADFAPLPAAYARLVAALLERRRPRTARRAGTAAFSASGRVPGGEAP